MSEDDQTVEVVPPVKSDMHSYSSTMTSKDVKALVLKHNIPLDLHLVALTAEWTMNKLTDDFIGLYEQYFEFSGVKVPFSTLLLDAMAWRHHESGIHDPLPTDGFSASDVATLTSQSIDIKPVPSGLLFHAGLATTWEFSGFLLVFKDTEGNFHDVRVSINSFLDVHYGQGDALSARNPITQRTTGPLPVNQSPPEKTARLKETKRQRFLRFRAEEEILLRNLFRESSRACTQPLILIKDVDDVETAESREDEHSFNESEGHGLTMTETVETRHANETRLTETPVPAPNPEKTAVQDISRRIALMGRPLVLTLFTPDRPSHRGLVWTLLRNADISKFRAEHPLAGRNWLNAERERDDHSGRVAKVLAMKRSEKDLKVELGGQVIDPHSDTRMTVRCPDKVKPSSKVTSVSRAVPSKVIPTATTTASKVTPSVTHSDKNPDPSHPLTVYFLNLRAQKGLCVDRHSFLWTCSNK
ncbi:hypothetical protein Tco_0740506 [Tanacetum coccineum]